MTGGVGILCWYATPFLNFPLKHSLNLVKKKGPNSVIKVQFGKIISKCNAVQLRMSLHMVMLQNVMKHSEKWYFILFDMTLDSTIELPNR